MIPNYLHIYSHPSQPEEPLMRYTVFHPSLGFLNKCFAILTPKYQRSANLRRVKLQEKNNSCIVLLTYLFSIRTYLFYRFSTNFKACSGIEGGVFVGQKPINISIYMQVEMKIYSACAFYCPGSLYYAPKSIGSTSYPSCTGPKNLRKLVPKKSDYWKYTSIITQF